LHPPRRDGGVVEEAKAHGPIAFGVVAGRTHRRKHAAVFAQQHGPARIYRAARRDECGIPRPLDHRSVGIGVRKFLGAGLFDDADMAGSVDPQEIVPRGRCAIDAGRV